MRTMQNLVNQDNPHVPAEAPALRGFNLMRGVAFMSVDEPDPRIWVAEKVTHDETFERVYVWAHDGAFVNSGLTSAKAFDLHYCDLVAFVGIVRNPDDHDDHDDFGVA